MWHAESAAEVVVGQAAAAKSQTYQKQSVLGSSCRGAAGLVVLQ